MAPIIFDSVSFGYPDSDSRVFEDLSLELPEGIVSLIGQNGTGKSTFLLLASGAAIPDEGTVTIDGIDTRELRDESERQRYTSFIFQNMEFETEETIGDLLPFVYANGFHADRTAEFTDELVKVFELENCLTKKTQEVSKGELQRAILTFSLLYGCQRSLDLLLSPRVGPLREILRLPDGVLQGSTGGYHASNRNDR